MPEGSYVWFYHNTVHKPQYLQRGRVKGWTKNGCLAVWLQRDGRDYFCDAIEQRHLQGGAMHQVIIDLFPQTKDAVLIEKWFGAKLSDPLFAMLLKGKEQELLAEALRLDKEQQEKQSSR